MNFRNVIVSGSRLCKRAYTTVAAPASASVKISLTDPTTVDDVKASQKAKEASRQRKRKMFEKLSKTTIATMLDDFTKEKDVTVTIADLLRWAKHFENNGEYRQALEIYEWMDNKEMTFSTSEHLIRVELIVNCKGLRAAEKYVSGINNCSFNKKAASRMLLECYHEELEREKQMLPLEDLLNPKPKLR